MLPIWEIETFGSVRIILSNGTTAFNGDFSMGLAGKSLQGNKSPQLQGFPLLDLLRGIAIESLLDRYLMLQNSVLMDARLVRKSIRSNNGFVRLHCDASVP